MERMRRVKLKSSERKDNFVLQQRVLTLQQRIQTVVEFTYDNGFSYYNNGLLAICFRFVIPGIKSTSKSGILKSTLKSIKSTLKLISLKSTFRKKTTVFIKP